MAFAASRNQTAEDGSGSNGLYTAELLKHIRLPGLPIERMFKVVRNSVSDATGGKQVPEEWTKLRDDFYFTPVAGGTTAPPAPPVVEPPRPTPPSAPTGPQVAVGVYPELPRPQRNSLGMEFVLIQAGTFQMGSNDGENDAKPVHTVRISKPFYLGTHEVTQGQWQAVMGNNPSQFQGDPTRPVEQVSWEDVQEFVRRVNAREQGRAFYRLPTEAEWEYAARAGTTTAYSFGDDAKALGRYAWFWENADRTTHSVGQKQPNAWGLYDMHGYAW